MMTWRNFAGAISAVVMLVGVAAQASAASADKIDRRVKVALEDFRAEVKSAESLLDRAVGVLVFPSVKKAGIGIGGEYGEGALLVGGKTEAYYSTAAASIGFQLGAQARTQILLFMEDRALERFRASDGWEAGVDGSIAVITLGAGGAIDTTATNEPIIAFIFNNKGLMYNLSLEGSKFTEIER